MPNLVGEIIQERYSVHEFLGRGGMAEVYKVWDNQRMTYLAMKILLEDLALDRVFIRRFTREANTLANLQHPNIVRFFGFEKLGRAAFMLMDYIEGETLKHFIHDAAGKSMPYGQIRVITRSVCGALHYAHSQGLVHCDIKPANIMIDQSGVVQLADFGIARVSDAATATMVGMGTPAYMAPEQIVGQDPLPQTDIYALGVVLYEMFTGGERPFTGDQAQITGGTSEKVRWEHINLQPPSPRQWNPSLSPQVEAVILKCLAKNPYDRFESAIELLSALERALGDVPDLIPVVTKKKKTPTCRPVETEQQTKIFLEQNIGWTIVLGFLLLAGALFIYSRMLGGIASPSAVPMVIEPSPVWTENVDNGTTPISEQVIVVITATSAPDNTKTPIPSAVPTNPPSPTATAPRFSPSQGIIAFATTRRGDSQIAVMNADGTGLYYLPVPSGKDYCDEPDILLDRSKIVYECKKGTNTDWNIYTVSISGSDLRSLGIGRQPDWSPNSRLIAFETRDISGNEQIWVMDSDGNGKRQITSDSFANRAPVWSPDGTQLVIMSEINNYWQVRVLDFSTGRIEKITNGNFDKRFPVWSPDGTKIAYNTKPSLDIWVIDIDGSNLKQVTDLGTAGRAAWSPDSQYLLFNALAGDEWRILRVRIDGSGLIAVSPSGGEDSQPDWSW